MMPRPPSPEPVHIDVWDGGNNFELVYKNLFIKQQYIINVRAKRVGDNIS
jgi:hypothetical protein